ncbi:MULTISPECIES: iron-containing redox enzyme family protein [Oscillatoriales]|nr:MULTISPECIES: iron-containing redox enzyme family protein [Oscillatoriales]
MLNLETYPQALPDVLKLAESYFKESSDYSKYPGFSYSLDAFEDWLNYEYNKALSSTKKDYWLDSGELWNGLNVGRFSQELVLVRLLQNAPFALLDGVWLTNILPCGPSNQVECMLFRIRMDEGGNGIFEQHHPNLYDRTIKNLGIDLAPVESRAFIENSNLMDFAFEEPVFQLAVGMFPRRFFPELLGMTLYLEWGETPVSLQLAKCLEGRNINPFYYTVHKKVDNIKDGHGFIAKKAVELYLQMILDREGEEQVPLYWQRIWQGYHTWEKLGIAFEQNTQTHLAALKDLLD